MITTTAGVKNPTRKKGSTARQRRFMHFMMNGITDNETLASPQAVYDWFVQEWGRPLNTDGLRQAWLAAWAISIGHGAVVL